MRRHGGFTLLELMLASVLMVMLMVGVLGVVASVVRPTQALARDQGSSVDVAGDATIDESVAWLLQEDLLQAVRIERGSGGLVLISYGGLDPRTHERTQRPVRVVYQTLLIGDRPWLVRVEEGLDDEAAERVRVDWVAGGVTRIELLPPPTKHREDPRKVLPSNNQVVKVNEITEPDIESLRDELWQLRLWVNDDEQPTIERAVVLQGGLSR